MKHRGAQDGFSLVELLVGVTLLGALCRRPAPACARTVARRARPRGRQRGAAVGAHRHRSSSYASCVAPASLRPLRFDRRCAPRLATGRRLASDLNGDGDTDDSNERVEYRFDAARRALMRVLGGASPQPMLMDVDSLDLTYLDANGVAVPLSGGAVAAADLRPHSSCRRAARRQDPPSSTRAAPRRRATVRPARPFFAMADRRQSGSALILVMLLIVVLTPLVASVAMQARLDLLIERHGRLPTKRSTSPSRYHSRHTEYQGLSRLAPTHSAPT